MTPAIDTNIFVYAHISDFGEHAVVRRFLKEQLAKPEAFCLSWQILYEYLRDPRCQILQEMPKHFASLCEAQNNLPSLKANELYYCHYATILKENGVKMLLTCDADFLKYDFLQVINPMHACA